MKIGLIDIDGHNFPNLLACKDLKPLLQQLIDSKAWIDMNQGLDIRMMTDEKADMLCRCKLKQVHFAWDRYEDRKVVLRKLRLFREWWERNHRWSEHNMIVYVMTNFDTTVEQDLERIYKLRDMGYWAYVMVYDREHADATHRSMARWCNNRRIFADCERFENYKRHNKQQLTFNFINYQ